MLEQMALSALPLVDYYYVRPMLVPRSVLLLLLLPRVKRKLKGKLGNAGLVAVFRQLGLLPHHARMAAAVKSAAEVEAAAAEVEAEESDENRSEIDLNCLNNGSCFDRFTIDASYLY